MKKLSVDIYAIKISIESFLHCITIKIRFDIFKEEKGNHLKRKDGLGLAASAITNVNINTFAIIVVLLMSSSKE